MDRSTVFMLSSEHPKMCILGKNDDVMSSNAVYVTRATSCSFSPYTGELQAKLEKVKE